MMEHITPALTIEPYGQRLKYAGGYQYADDLTGAAIQYQVTYIVLRHEGAFLHIKVRRIIRVFSMWRKPQIGSIVNQKLQVKVIIHRFYFVQVTEAVIDELEHIFVRIMFLE